MATKLNNTECLATHLRLQPGAEFGHHKALAPERDNSVQKHMWPHVDIMKWSGARIALPDCEQLKFQHKTACEFLMDDDLTYCKHYLDPVFSKQILIC